MNPRVPLEEHPVYKVAVDSLTIVEKLYGREAVDQVYEEVTDPDQSGGIGAVNPLTGGHIDPVVTDFINTIGDTSLRDLLSPEVIYIDDLPSELPASQKNTQLWWNDLQGRLMGGQPFRDENGLIDYPIRAGDGNLVLPGDLYAGKPVQDDYFWSIAPCTVAWDQSGDTAVYTTARVAKNRESYLEIMRVYTEEYLKGNRA